MPEEGADKQVCTMYRYIQVFSFIVYKMSWTDQAGNPGILLSKNLIHLHFDVHVHVCVHIENLIIIAACNYSLAS